MILLHILGSGGFLTVLTREIQNFATHAHGNISILFKNEFKYYLIRAASKFKTVGFFGLIVLVMIRLISV